MHVCCMHECCWVLKFGIHVYYLAQDLYLQGLYHCVLSFAEHLMLEQQHYLHDLMHTHHGHLHTIMSYVHVDPAITKHGLEWMTC